MKTETTTITFECDRCGKIVDDSEGIAINTKVVPRNLKDKIILIALAIPLTMLDCEINTGVKYYDLCKNCSESLKTWLENP